jgi:hypothetical protein
MADNQFVMGSKPLAEPALPRLRPAGVGALTWALANAAGRPGLRYGVLLVAIAAGLIGSAALLGHAANAPTLAAYDRNLPCGAGGSAPPDCRALASGSVLADRPLPLGVHAVTLAFDGHQAVYYGWAESYYTGTLPARSDALLVSWHGRIARVVGPGLTLQPFEGPPGAGFLLIAVAVVCELVCGLALILHGALWRLRARALPVVFERPSRQAIRPPGRLVFVGALAVVLLAGRTGHALVAAPLHALCGAVLAALCGLAGLSSGRALVPVARRGLDALSEEPALRLGADVALAAVLVALCISLAADLVVADLLTLPR